MTSRERIQKALAIVATGPRTDPTLPQAAFNFLKSGMDFTVTQQALKKALDNWADTVLGPEENGNGGGRWADDGGGHTE